jgi:hypothetical protein
VALTDPERPQHSLLLPLGPFLLARGLARALAPIDRHSESTDQTRTSGLRRFSKRLTGGRAQTRRRSARFQIPKVRGLPVLMTWASMTAVCPNGRLLFSNRRLPDSIFGQGCSTRGTPARFKNQVFHSELGVSMSTIQKRSTIALETRLSILFRDAGDLERQLYELNKLRWQVRQAELSAGNRGAQTTQ